MKNIKMVAALILAGCFVFAGCTGSGGGEAESSSAGSHTESSTVSGSGNESTQGEEMDFKFIQISLNYSSAEDYVYEAEAEEDGGVTLTHYTAFGYASEERNMVREITAGEDVRKEIARLLSECNVKSWDGFSESDPDVLDGSGFSLSIELADGSSISAHGSNAWPDNFGRLSGYLEGMLVIGQVEDTYFENYTYAAELPESWVDVVNIRFQDGFTTFFLTENDKEVSLASIAVSSYGYEDYSEDDTRAGVLTEDGEIRYYVTVRNHDPYAGDISSIEGENIAAELPEDLTVLAESITGLNGLVFVPEGGGELYKADARTLFDKARSLWLNIFLAAEYPSGRKQIEENGRVYDSAFASYERQSPRNEEGLRELFLQYFTEEFTDYLMNKMAEEGDLIVRDNVLYVPAVKVENNALYGNGYVKDVRKEDDGRYTVIVEVMKASPEDERYSYSLREELEFPVERNEEGSYVFSAFPYWDRQY